jgi:4-hydroxy-2-oxoheptanedioate aldolase
MVPQVDTVEQATHIASAKLFGSKVNGTRSFPPGRYMPGYSAVTANPNLSLTQSVNEQAALFIQTESILGVDNLDAILTEVGQHIDGVWLGTLDLRASMGLDGPYGGEPEFIAAVEKWTNTAKKHNKPIMGFVLGPPEVQAQQAVGKSFLLTGFDFATLMTAAGPLAYVRENFPATNWSAINEQATKQKALAGV